MGARILLLIATLALGFIGSRFLSPSLPELETTSVPLPGVETPHRVNEKRVPLPTDPRLTEILRQAEKAPLKALGGISESNTDTDFAFRVWAFSDFASAITTAREIDAQAKKSYTTRSVLSVLARRSPEAWARHLLDHPQDASRYWGQSYNGAIRTLARQGSDLPASLISIFPESARAGIRILLLEVLAETNPLAAAEKAEQIADENEKLKSVAKILGSLASTDEALAVDLVRTLPDLSSWYLESAIQDIAKSDPDLALRVAEKIWDGLPSEADLISGAVLRSLFFTDPEKAIGFLTNSDEAFTRRFFLNQEQYIPASTYPAFGESVLASGKKHLISEYIQDLLPRVAQMDPSAARQWLEAASTKFPEMHARGVSKIGIALAEGNGTLEEISELVSLVPESSQRGRRAAEIAGRMVQLGLRDEATQLMLQPDVGHLSLDNFTLTWAQVDPEGAIQWADSLATEQQRRQAWQGIEMRLGDTEFYKTLRNPK